MKSLGFGRYALCSCVAAAMLAGCGGSQPPIGAPGAMPQSRTVATRAQHGGSWMLPEAKSEDLLYVSSHSWVSVYTYPQGRLVGKLGGYDLASGQCVDSASNVYITDYATNHIYEYRHGGSKRIHTRTMPGANSCSIDPTTGNLAVSSLGDTGVWIFKRNGARLKYKSPKFYSFYDCGYDPKGNLFVDGMTRPGTGNFIFAELHVGDSKLKIIKLNQYIGWPGGIQWDGKHIAVGDQAAPAIYQFSVKGREGSKVGTTPMGSNASDTLQFWIQGQTVITSTVCSPNKCGSTGLYAAVMFFNYPNGGNARKFIVKGLLGEPGGDSVSLAP
jgi:hypothetical protein